MSEGAISPSSLLVQLKHRLLQQKSEDSFRVFHGRGKTTAGWTWLNIDCFSNVLLLTAYQHEPLSIGELSKLLLQEFHAKEAGFENITCIALQRRFEPGAPIECIVGELPEPAFAVRNTMKYGISFGQQNIGFFLDIEPVRKWVEGACQGKRVLNMFAYTCAFSVVAAASGAAAVVNIDMSKRSIARGKENHRLNNLHSEDVMFLAHDIFKSWGKLKKYGPYDIVIIDPPSFQKGSFIARKDYSRVLVKMSALIAPQGQFVACLNAPEIHVDEFITWVESSCPDFSLSEVLGAHKDFPEGEIGKGLKMLVYTKKG